MPRKTLFKKDKFLLSMDNIRATIYIYQYDKSKDKEINLFFKVFLGTPFTKRKNSNGLQDFLQKIDLLKLPILQKENIKNLVKDFYSDCIPNCFIDAKLEMQEIKKEHKDINWINNFLYGRQKAILNARYSNLKKAGKL